MVSERSFHPPPSRWITGFRRISLRRSIKRYRECTLAELHASAFRARIVSTKLEEYMKERRRATRIVQPSWEQFAGIFIRVLEEKDPYTRGHSQRVREYAGLLTRALGWDDFRIWCTETAALLHDIGKVVVDNAILRNQRPQLLPEQWAELIDHPYDGAQMVRGIFPIEVQLGILQHHERMDGKVDAVSYPAYPFGIPGHLINPVARVIAVCDSYDAMTTQRSYNVPVPKQDALRLLREGAGSRHDKDIVKTFIARVAPALTTTA